MVPNRQTEMLFAIPKTFPFLERPAEPRATETLRHHVIRHERVFAEPAELEPEMPIGGVLGELVGTSPAMQGIFSTIRQVAPTSAPVLICGETGTGKELVRVGRAGNPQVIPPRRWSFRGNQCSRVTGEFERANCSAMRRVRYGRDGAPGGVL
jgi:hypothetical protein